MMYHHWFGMGAGDALLAVLVVVLLAGAVIALVVATTRGAGSSPRVDRPAEDEAERVLADRFARGEVDCDEYEQRLRTLRATRPSR
jgi:putative membrane protein